MMTTPFLHFHEALGARLVDFAGFRMPISYQGIKEEHLAVRANAGVFDVSHMGEFLVQGQQSLHLIQRLTCNDGALLKTGQAQYTCLMNESGGIIDDLIVYCLEESMLYMMVVNAANIEKDWKWVNDNNLEGAKLYNISSQTCLLAIQGPKALDIVSPLTNVDLKTQKSYTFEIGDFAGVSEVIISATGYTGSGGIEIYFQNEEDHVHQIWNALFENKGHTGLQPIGLGARDSLRLEKGYCLYGNDIDESTTPLEAGLQWITKLKTKDFIGKEALLRQKERGIDRKLVGFKFLEKGGLPRQGYPISKKNGESIGVVTSGTKSPSLDEIIGLGYVSKDDAKEGTKIDINIRNKRIAAEITKLPFI